MSTSLSRSKASRTFEYALVDVFAEHALEGNMLAIFTDARGLSTQEMQALAREMNLAETTFLLPDDPASELEQGVRARIFTVEEELPFAGHPTLGTASWLFWNHPTLRGAEAIRLRLDAGSVTVRFKQAQPQGAGVYGTMRQMDPVFGAIEDVAAVAAAIGLEAIDLHPDLLPQTVSTGLPFCIVPVRSRAVLQRLEVPQGAARAYLATVGAKFFYVLAAAEEGSDVDFFARMQFYNGEDPATGSAAGCAIAYLVAQGVVAGGKEVVLSQGAEIRRPSRINLRASLTDGQVHEVFVSGRTIPVASGRFSLP